MKRLAAISLALIISACASPSYKEVVTSGVKAPGYDTSVPPMFDDPDPQARWEQDQNYGIFLRQLVRRDIDFENINPEKLKTLSPGQQMYLYLVGERMRYLDQYGAYSFPRLGEMPIS